MTALIFIAALVLLAGFVWWGFGSMFLPEPDYDATEHPFCATYHDEPEA